MECCHSFNITPKIDPQNAAERNATDGKFGADKHTYGLGPFGHGRRLVQCNYVTDPSDELNSLGFVQFVPLNKRLRL